MATALSDSPEGNYRQARLIVRLGVLMPAGKEGWVAMDELLKDSEGRTMWRFVSGTNHDLIFRIYPDEIEII